MVLLLDLGNTNLYIGVYKDDKFINEYRTDSDLKRSSDMYATLIIEFLKRSNINPNDFEGAILSSVIPSITDVIVRAVNSAIHTDCLVVGAGIKTGLQIKIDNPSELGADLVCDSVGAIKKYNYPAIICDLGTANKLLVINNKGQFAGCIISPGIKTAQKALSNGAAQLMDISFKAPRYVIGKNSADSLNSGAIYGTIAMIEGLTRMIEDELGYKCERILTGGNSSLIKNSIPSYTYDGSLIFEGLYQIYLKNK